MYSLSVQLPPVIKEAAIVIAFRWEILTVPHSVAAQLFQVLLAETVLRILDVFAGLLPYAVHKAPVDVPAVGVIPALRADHPPEPLILVLCHQPAITTSAFSVTFRFAHASFRFIPSFLLIQFNDSIPDAAGKVIELSVQSRLANVCRKASYKCWKQNSKKPTLDHAGILNRKEG